MIKVLFVCHGNICRSPMAEFVMKDMVRKLHLENEFVIESAATSSEEIWNGVGNPVYPPVRELLKRRGISCDEKRARQLRRDDYDRWDYIIGMDHQNMIHMQRILGRSDKSRMLLSYINEARGVQDPWYTGNFEAVYQDVCAGCEALLQCITDKELNQ